jgi:hypothetical protein
VALFAAQAVVEYAGTATSFAEKAIKTAENYLRREATEEECRTVAADALLFSSASGGFDWYVAQIAGKAARVACHDDAYVIRVSVAASVNNALYVAVMNDKSAFPRQLAEYIRSVVSWEQVKSEMEGDARNVQKSAPVTA